MRPRAGGQAGGQAGGPERLAVCAVLPLAQPAQQTNRISPHTLVSLPPAGAAAVAAADVAIARDPSSFAYRIVKATMPCLWGSLGALCMEENSGNGIVPREFSIWFYIAIAQKPFHVFF